MRLQRGAGLAGLAGIRPRAEIEGLIVLRPLLGWRRAELAGIVAETGPEPGRGPVQCRRALRSRPPAHASRGDGLARYSGARAQRDGARRGGGGARLDGGAAHRRTGRRRGRRPDLRRRRTSPPSCAAAPCSACSPCSSPPSRRGARRSQRLLAALEAGETATLAGVKCAGGPVWRLSAAPPRRAS